MIDGYLSNGSENMAVDEALFSLYDKSNGEPILRVYGWSCPTVSIGYFQRWADAVKKSECDRYHVALVRRPTGGRAVLHDNEITYCVVGATSSGPFAGGLMDCYKRIAECLGRGLRRVGVPQSGLTLAPAHRRLGAGRQPACFFVTAAFEIMYDGKKLVGSAQRRAGEVFLQHGSIPIRIDRRLINQVLNLGRNGQEPPEREPVAGPTCLEEVLGRQVSFEEAKDAIIEGFAEALGACVNRSNLNANERALAERLSKSRYGCDEWNLRR